MTFEEALKIAHDTDKSKITYRKTSDIYDQTIRIPYYSGHRHSENIGIQWFKKYQKDIEDGKYIIGIATYWGYNKPEYIDDNIGLYET